MASPGSSTPSLTPSRSPSPQPPVQPDHFYGNEDVIISSPSSNGKAWLDPADDPLAQRGIPVFRPTMEEFQDFEGYMNKIECWGMRSGIVKVIPPKEWTDALPPVNDQLANVKIRNPIEQHMLGQAGLFRQENVEKRRHMSVREWAELCSREDLRAPGVDDTGLHARATASGSRTKTRRTRRKTRGAETAEPEMTPEVKVKDEHDDEDALIDNLSPLKEEVGKSVVSDVAQTDVAANGQDEQSELHQQSTTPDVDEDQATTPDRRASVEDCPDEADNEVKPKPKGRRAGQTKEARAAALALRAAKDKAFLENFDPHSDWLPPNTTPFDYTIVWNKDIERKYWRNLGLGVPAWYGADMAGSLFTDATKVWNVAHLPSTLTRLLPASSKGLPGVNTPYLYFGMWRATFAWHVEDMDLFSINYIHFGAPKFWYAMPQARASALERVMKGYFPKDTSQCPQFLRHKSFLASPKLLSQSSCRPNTLVQQAGEFVITYPRGYHAGFNLGFNCAESVNFALDSWLDLGRKAKACECVEYSVRIDVDRLLADRAAERAAEEEVVAPEPEPGPPKPPKPKASRKRKPEVSENAEQPRPKKIKLKASRPEPEPSTAPTPLPSKPTPKVTLKLPPKPKELETFPCCLCVSQSRDGLLPVQDPPLWRKEAGSGDTWMAHEECANVIPETWVDEIEVPVADGSGYVSRVKVVFGVDAIVKDRWNLKCTACTKGKNKAHGAPIQCTKGKCPKAFHVSCAREGGELGIIYCVLREIEKEVVLLDSQALSTPVSDVPPNVDDTVIDPSLLSAHSGGAMNIDTDYHPSRESSTTVLKLIKKTEVQVLCSQHNPAIAEAKKAHKQDKIRNDLLALPDGARIKLRVSAGVFEVTLLRVIEETKSVEVLWDRGMKREFKWGSVVFGATDTVVGHKPSEPAAEHPRPANPPTQFVPLQTTAPTVHVRPAQYDSTSTPGAGPSQPSTSTYHAPTTPATYPEYNQPSSAYPYPSYYQQSGTSTYQYAPGNWAYQYHSGHYNSNPNTYSQQSYYRPPYSSGAPYPQYQGFSYAPSTQPSTSTATPYAQYQQPSPPQPQISTPPPPPPPQQQPYQTPATTAAMRKELQWQRPYTGPKGSMVAGDAAPSAEPGGVSQSENDQVPPSIATTAPLDSSASATLALPADAAS